MDDDALRAELRAWLDAHVVGEYAAAGAEGGPGSEHLFVEARRRWEYELASGGWTCVGWPVEYGGRGLSLQQQVVFHEEYVRSGAPTRVNVIGETLLGPTLIAFGTDEQKAAFLPGIVSGRELWCQGYSEPDAGSDLANVKTSAVLDGAEWRVTGQKVWTSLALEADWCFVLCRTEAGSQRHRGLSYLLVPMHQPGIEIRPIVQLTGTSEFNEVFFDGARAPAENVVGGLGNGWKVAMATLGFERGISTLSVQLSFQREIDALIACARANGKVRDAVVRDRIAHMWSGLQIMRWIALRGLAGHEAGAPGPEASVAKLFWSNWHRDMGNLRVDVAGADALVADAAPYELSAVQRAFLFSRSDTIYGGSAEIQRNILGERVLGLPAEPKA
ncbi:MAG TPA: acyl-CoA dehydrogenase family protein [Acidimicrobiales bacterium]|nr:acyl-CoA dehydrogenase family protein [Acidimicrobiales bacterium]